MNPGSYPPQLLFPAPFYTVTLRALCVIHDLGEKGNENPEEVRKEESAREPAVDFPLSPWFVLPGGLDAVSQHVAVSALPLPAHTHRPSFALIDSPQKRFKEHFTSNKLVIISM